MPSVFWSAQHVGINFHLQLLYENELWAGERGKECYYIKMNVLAVHFFACDRNENGKNLCPLYISISVHAVPLMSHMLRGTTSPVHSLDLSCIPSYSKSVMVLLYTDFHSHFLLLLLSAFQFAVLKNIMFSMFPVK